MRSPSGTGGDAVNRDEWLSQRKVGIGGSDAAAILGLSPWKSPLDVWLDKTGRAPAMTVDPDREDLLYLGQVLEPAIAAMYERKTNRELVQVKGIVRHSEYPCIIGTPDRLVVGERRGVELKSEHAFVDKFGDPGTDEVPEYYAVQCMQYMAIEEFDAWDLALLHGGAKFAIYTLNRNREVEIEMIRLLCDWWDRHVVADVPPPIDGSESATRYLANEFRRNARPLADANEVETKLALELGRIRAQFAELEDYKKLLENRIRQAIGDRDGIRGSFGKVTWKRTKDGTEIDFEAAYTDAMREMANVFRLLPEDQMLEAQELVMRTFDEVRTRHTHLRDGYRRLLYTPAKG